jgi:hypothetical protein
MLHLIIVKVMRDRIFLWRRLLCNYESFLATLRSTAVILIIFLFSHKDAEIAEGKMMRRFLFPAYPAPPREILLNRITERTSE